MTRRLLLVWTVLSGIGVATAINLPGTPVAAEDDLAKELPRIKALDPDAALKAFRGHAGFRVEAVAVEPLVTDPVSVCYDADGRLYVVEMRGYPYPENSPTGNVSLLVDADGDGRFDKKTIFVDGLSWPTSVVPYDGGVFIAVAPDILYAKDVDGDGKADVRKVMFNGFNTQNVQGLVNGLLWGLDGWIYGVTGGNGGEIKNLTRPDARPVSVRGRDFRFRPDGSVFEAISGGGQFGHSFDDWGHRFTCNNSNHIRQILLPADYLERNPALVIPSVLDDIAAEGPAAPVFRISPPEPWRVVRTRQRAADPAYARRLPPTELVAIGFFTSATGVTIYRGTAFPAEYRGNAFIGDVGGNLVHRKILTRNGDEFRATRADQQVEFLASPDNWFRPVNFANTPDGTLLILDMYRETIEHPESIPAPIKKHLDLTSGKDLGRLYNLVPEGGVPHRRPALSKASTEELVGALADPDAWWRETAQRLLIERRDPAAIPLLKALARERPSALGRMHALCTLRVLGDLGEEELIAGLRDPEPGVREQSARLSEGLVAERPGVAEALLALANDPDTMVRFQAALSLGALADPRAIPALATIAVKDADSRWTRAAVLSAVGGRTAALLGALGGRDGFFAHAPGRIWLDELAALVGAENRPADTRMLLDRFAGPDADPAQVRAVILGLGRGLQRSGGSLRQWLLGPDAARLAPIFDHAARVADSEGPLRNRVEAIRLLGLGSADRAVEILTPLLDARQPGEIQLATLQTLGPLPDRRVAEMVLSQWKALSPSMRREAVEVLFARPERLALLLDAIEASRVQSSDLDPGRRTQLLALKDPKLRHRAEQLLGTSPGNGGDRGQVIVARRKALELTGDLGRGREVYKKTCATCHKAEGLGVEVGPNLATVAGRSPEDLLVHILDPNREVAPPYINYNVATTDGRVVSGLIADESANSLTLKRAEGVTDVIPRNRIEAISSTGQSLMPEGLEKGFEPQDFADLIAYLRSLQASAGPTPAPR
jgi:putative membrane-bound dehydrogenase-like protein